MKENFSSLEKIIRKYMRKNKIPGLTVSILKEDSIVYSRGFGARDLEAFLPMTPQTLIGIGSVTKSITAFGIMKLVERKAVSLDDSASKFLDYAPFSLHPEITIKHMLSHSTGVPAADAGLAALFYTFGDYNRVYPAANREDFMAHMGEPEDFNIFKPGEKFFYNNDMYVCLGFIIEQITGQKYEDFIHNEILMPLGMKRAVFTREKFDKDPLNDIITGYLPKRDGDVTIPKKYPVPIFDYLCAPGGLYVSMEEIMHYARCMLQRGEYNGRQLIKPESVESLWTPVIATPYGFGKNPQYCLGWVRDEGYFPHTLIHHGGGLGTSCTSFVLLPDVNIAVAAAQNSCAGVPSTVTLSAVSLLLEEDPLQHVEALKIEQVIDEISGLYKSPHDLYEMKIIQKGSVLYAEMETDDGPVGFPLIPEDLKEFVFKICIPQPTRRMVQFIRNRTTNKVEFAAYDRYLYRRC